MEITSEKLEQFKAYLPDTTIKIIKFLANVQNYKSVDEYIDTLVCIDFIKFAQENQSTLEKRNPLFENEVK